MIDQITKQEFMSTSKRCTYCEKVKRDQKDLESIFETGMCLGCDSAYAEDQEDQLRDLETIGL